MTQRTSLPQAKTNLPLAYGNNIIHHTYTTDLHLLVSKLLRHEVRASGIIRQ